MNTRHPDIEIYIKRVETERVIEWLTTHFDIVSTRSAGEDSTLIQLLHQGQSLSVLVFERAAKGGYSSVWFKENKTPWDNDLQCAEDAFAFLAAEIRCSRAGWQSSANLQNSEIVAVSSDDLDEADLLDEDGEDSADDEGGWIRITEKGQAIINWRT